MIDLIKKQREFFNMGKTLDIEYRLKKLIKLKSVIAKYQGEIIEALKLDLGKAPLETYFSEIYAVNEEINYFIKKLKKLSKAEFVMPSISNFPATAKIYKRPYGVTLVISPWNYPFQLAIKPMVESIAGGNTVVVKPSELSEKTADIIEKIVDEVFEEEYIKCVKGGKSVGKKLLSENFDYIFFTGSQEIGKEVLRKASENFTPVTLELGGKSPVIVDETANIDIAARRIVWGKFLNCGQTCVAPDYVIVKKDVEMVLIKKIQDYIEAFYGENPMESSDYGKIINEKHFSRIINLMKNENILYGGNFDKGNLKITPTLMWVEKPLKEKPRKIMEEEIFGPLLPIMRYETLDEVKKIIQKNENPLALYLFTKNKKMEQWVVGNLQFGGGCINDTILHVADVKLPFGGIGKSGMGRTYGKYGFETFTYKKTVLKRYNFLDNSLRYPPYKTLKTLQNLFLK